MNKIKFSISILVVTLLCLCCFFLGRSNDNALIVENGVIKYNNDGKFESILSLEDLFNKDSNVSTLNGKNVEFSIKDGYIIWNYVGETKVNKLIALSKLVGKQGENGKDGIDGTDGQDGLDGKDGKSSYIWIKYLENSPESSTDEELLDMTSNYLGIYYGESSVAPTDIASYKWQEVKGNKGEKGDQGIQGEKGEKGDKGDDGVNGVDGKDGKDGKDGVITEIAFIKGTVKKAENNSPVVYITNDDGLFYSSSDNISVKKGVNSKVVLDSGKFLITLNGSITFTGDYKELPVYFYLDGNVFYSDIYEGSLDKTYFSTTQYVDTINSNGFFEIAMALLYSYDNVNYTITIMKIE